MAASCSKVLTLSVVASATLAAYRAVTATGAIPAAGARCFGVTDFSAQSGERVSVGVLGTVIAESGGAFAIDALLEIDALGRFVAAASGAKVARAITAAVSGGALVEVLLIQSSDSGGGPVVIAPTVKTAAAIIGQPTVNVPLVITAATFNGSPAPTGTRTIEMDGVVVANGNLTTTYTPQQADVGKVATVEDVGTNVAGSATSTATGAAVVAGATQSLAASETWEVFSSITANAVRTGLLSSTRTSMSIANPATNLQTMEYALVDQPNFNRNVPSTGWVELPPGAQDNITDADAKKQMYTRVRASDTKAVTAASCSGTTATYTIPNHGLTGSSNVRGFEGITPAGYNIRNVPVTVVDANTLTATILATQAAATAFGVMLNCHESVITRRLEPK